MIAPSATPATGHDEFPLLSIPEGKSLPPRARIKDAEAARRIYAKMRDDDLVNAANRAECQDLLNGAPPYSNQELGEANIDLPNINWRGAEQQLERAMAPYYRLSASPEHVVKVFTRFGPDDGRQELNDTLSEEITHTLRSSPSYMNQRLLRDHKKIRDGLAIAYHPDDVDWRFRAAGLGQFYFDRHKFICEDDQEVVCAVDPTSVTALYQKIAGEDTGRWNKKAVLKAIQKGQKDRSNFEDWERLADEMKNNDLAVGSTSPPVILIHLWVEEFNGTVSHYITTEVDCETKEFLYEYRGKYQSMSEVMTLFPDGLGTNAEIHGMRGLLYKIFPMEQQRNRSLSRFLAAGDLASSLIMQCQDEESLANVGLQYFGNLAVIPPGFNANPVQMPNLQAAVMPAIDMMERLRKDRVAGYTTENVFDGDQRKTKFEVAAHLDQSVSLSESQVDLHYLCEDRLAKQTVKRMTRRTYVAEDPGGKDIVALHRRLMERDPSGQLLEAFFRIDHTRTRAGRAIGSGSAGARTVALQRADELKPDMDDRGRYKLARWKAIDLMGSAAADELLPPEGPTRTTPHTNIALLENEVLYGQGREWPVQESDPHLLHAREHIRPLVEMMEAEKLGQLPIEEMAMRGRPGWLHSVDHIERVGGDEATLDEVAQIRQFLQQVGEPIENGLKRAKAMAEQQAEEGGEEGGEEGQQGGPSPEQIVEIERHNEQLRQSRERFEVEQEQRVRKAQTDIAIADAKAAAEIARKGKVQAATNTTTQ